MIAWIPNMVTLTNLFCGCLGLIFLHKGDINLAGCMILAGVLFDFFDGMVARTLKVSSELGKQLDSLADLVSFGVLPSMIMYELIQKTTSNIYLPFLSIIIALLSALRLGMFNVSTEQSDKFIGIPTTAYGIYISSLAINYGRTDLVILNDCFNSSNNLIFIVLLSILLVAKMPYLSFKYKDFSIAHNWPRFIMIIIFILSIAIFKAEGITLGLLIYILCGSLMQYFIKTFCSKENA